LSYICFTEDTFLEGGEYTFKMSASYALFGSASATITFDINRPPKWGSFFIAKQSGVELVDVFELKALDWKDPEETDYPLSYAYKYTDDDGNKVDIRKPAQDATFKTTLPRLSTDDMPLILEVYDTLDDFTESSLTVQVTKQDDAERAVTIAAQISGLAISQLDDRAALINAIPTDFAITEV